MSAGEIQPPATDERPRRLNAAVEHLHGGRFAESANLAQQLIAESPRDMDALMVLGLALGGLGELDRAALLLTRVARERPNYAHPCADLADLLRRQDRLAEAYAQFRAACALEASDLRLAYTHAEFLLETGRAAEALGELERALRLRPAFPTARRLWAIALAECGRLDEALLHLRRAVAAEPLNPEAHANLAIALGNSGQFEAALAAFSAALFHAPDDATLHVLRAMALLKSGRLPEGFAEFEWRARQPGQPKPLPPERLLPDLANLGALAGRSVLLTHDEGLGDTLQFLRYAPLLARRGMRVIAWVPPELARLVRAMPEFAMVLSDDTAIPNPDFHCPFISLPRVFGTTLATIPAEVPYLRPDPA
ncbi:MAG: tetratricopeptide repeat protein, partial [Alphaproteobacteria bacterium]|nr:tetratricopeptide repeat protein [Alphaproteobacteria bacterium]